MNEIETIKGKIMDNRQIAFMELEQIKSNKSDYVVIHYSCESFDNTTSYTPRVLCITVRGLADSVTSSFGINLAAEEAGIKPENIRQNYDLLEGMLLKDFYLYLEKNIGKTFLHWRMRDNKYGFEAIRKRCECLKIFPDSDYGVFDNIKQKDMAEIFKKVYGRGYIKDPKLINIFKKNKLSEKDALSAEKSMVEENNYQSLNAALLRKVDNLATVIDLALYKKLKTDWKFQEVYSFTPAGIFGYAKDNWKGALLLFMLGVFVSAIIVNLANILFSKFISIFN